MAEMAKLWTVDDLAELADDGRRYEIIDGELLVTPGPSFDHQRAVRKLILLTAPYLAQQRVGELLFAPADVAFSNQRVVQPDLFVVPVLAGNPPKSFTDVERLLLAIEVVSPSTARVDRVIKRGLYRAEHVPEYWVVDLDARVFERSTPRDARVEVITNLLEWKPEGATTPFVLDVEAFFTDL